MMVQICEAGRDPCGCDQWKKGIRTINGQYPDDNRDFDINAGDGIEITPATAGINIAVKTPFPGPMIFRGTVGTGGTIATLPTANADNLGWTYVAITAGSTPDSTPKSYEIGDTLVSNGQEWIVIPSGDDPVDWSQIQNKPTTISGYGITDAVTLNTTQSITAKKTFKNELIADNEHSIGGNMTANIDIVMQNTQGTVPTDNSHFGALRFLDKVGTYDAGIMYTISTSGNKFFSIGWTGDGLGTVDIGRQGANGDIYTLAPTRPYNSANTRDVVTIGSLASNPNVVHTIGYELIDGEKAFLKVIDRKQDYDNNNNIVVLNVFDGSNNFESALYIYKRPDGKKALYWSINNSLGTTEYIELARSN